MLLCNLSNPPKEIGSNMLIKFKVENFRSFWREQSLDMTAGPVRTHSDHAVEYDGVRILTSAMVFGANASGKTNLVKAIAESRSFIADGTPIAAGQHCRTIEGSEDEATSFEYTVMTDGAVYSYGFELMLGTGKVRSEWLRRLDRTGHTSVFDRSSEGTSTDLELCSADNVAFEACSSEVTRAGGLLLRALAGGRYDGGLESCRRIMSWFGTKLVVIPSGSARYPMVTDAEALSEMLRSFDTGITGVSFEHVPEGSSVADADRMVLRHSDARFRLGDESAGTRRLIELAPVLYMGSGGDVTFVVDEFDRSMHPKLAERFVSEFGRKAGGLRRQLITTVHEPHLMDLNLLRRDELWIVSMTDEGSELYPEFDTY